MSNYAFQSSYASSGGRPPLSASSAPSSRRPSLTTRLSSSKVNFLGLGSNSGAGANGTGNGQSRRTLESQFQDLDVDEDREDRREGAGRQIMGSGNLFNIRRGEDQNAGAAEGDNPFINNPSSFSSSSYTRPRSHTTNHYVAAESSSSRIPARDRANSATGSTLFSSAGNKIKATFASPSREGSSGSGARYPTSGSSGLRARSGSMLRSLSSPTGSLPSLPALPSINLPSLPSMTLPRPSMPSIPSWKSKSSPSKIKKKKGAGGSDFIDLEVEGARSLAREHEDRVGGSGRGEFDDLDFDDQDKGAYDSGRPRVAAVRRQRYGSDTDSDSQPTSSPPRPQTKTQQAQKRSDTQRYRSTSNPLLTTAFVHHEFPTTFSAGSDTSAPPSPVLASSSPGAVEKQERRVHAGQKISGDKGIGVGIALFDFVSSEVMFSIQQCDQCVRCGY